MNVFTRKMRESDLDDVLVLEKEIFSSPWPRSAFLMEIRRPNGEYLVAEAQKEIIGYSGVVREERDFHVTTMAVHPAYRRMGIATYLMLIHIDEALAASARRFFLEVRRSNVKAQSFYLRFGFQPGGLMTNYYSSEGEDAVIMWVPDLRNKGFLEAVSGIRRALEEKFAKGGTPDAGPGT